MNKLYARSTDGTTCFFETRAETARGVARAAYKALYGVSAYNVASVQARWMAKSAEMDDVAAAAYIYIMRDVIVYRTRTTGMITRCDSMLTFDFVENEAY